MSTTVASEVEHDGARTHYLDVRPHDDDASLAPIVFVPGMTDVADDYRSVADHTGRRTIVIDLRAHGQSRASSGWTLEHHVDDIRAVVADAVDGPLHLMTFSRGTCYALGFCAEHRERVLSLTIGDYPAREIGLTAEVGDMLLNTTWRGTPVRERIDETTFDEFVAASRDRPLWHVVAALDVPVAVVRSAAKAPINDDDWERYDGLTPDIRRIVYDDSPHDIFRRDRTRYPRLVAEVAADGDRRATARVAAGAGRSTDQEG